MVSITTEKRGGTVRINISAKEFAQLIPDDANRALVLHWIKIGREREGIRDHVEEIVATNFAAQRDELTAILSEIQSLKEALGNFIAFFAQVTHSITISTTAPSQFDLESIHFDKLNGNKLSHEKEQTYALAQIKHRIFKQLMETHLPDITPKFDLTNFLKNDGNQDA